ncbi:hypothetical protein R3P38DRAFT_2772007 [Favolaschia claudopus]|uniref:Uncharacterized protein n=1 Tax=Favolaschia claudopus TaxID=2862362 RepID=A0AAW0C962_9AGAR
MPVEALVLFWTKDCTRADASEHSVFRCSHPHPPWRRRATPSRRRTRRSVAKPLDFDDSSSSAPSKNVSLMLVNAFWGTFATSSSPSTIRESTRLDYSHARQGNQTPGKKSKIGLSAGCPPPRAVGAVGIMGADTTDFSAQYHLKTSRQNFIQKPETMRRTKSNSEACICYKTSHPGSSTVRMQDAGSATRVRRKSAAGWVDDSGGKQTKQQYLPVFRQ